MFVKIVNNDETLMLECKTCTFSGSDGDNKVVVDEIPYVFKGKAYIMNDVGITVDSYPGRTGR